MMMSSRVVLSRRFPLLKKKAANKSSFSTTTAATVLAANNNNKMKWEKPVTLVLVGALVAGVSVGSSSHRFVNGSDNNTTTSLEAATSTSRTTTTTAMIKAAVVPFLSSISTVIVKDPTLEGADSHKKQHQRHPQAIHHQDSTSDSNLKKEDDDVSSSSSSSSLLLVQEPVTGILFEPVFESKHLLGVGVRKKYRFVNVYALACYVNPDDFRNLQPDEYEKTLLDPQTHRKLRLIMNRSLTMEKVISAVTEAIEPRMHGKDLHALEHFAKLRNYGSLNEGDDIVLTITGDSVECKCSNGGSNVTTSEVFARAVCDVYFGKDAISPTTKESVLAGISEL